jgi:hypothetical protein
MIEDKEDDVEELFGDECTLDCADAFVEDNDILPDE